MDIQLLPHETLVQIMDYISQHLDEMDKFLSTLQSSQRRNVKKAAMTQILERVEWSNFFPEEKAYLQEAVNNGKGDFTAGEYLSLHNAFAARYEAIMPDYTQQVRESVGGYV